MPRLAVVISPNWHDYAEKYLAQCLASLRAQTFKDFDLFLVDNETSPSSYDFLKTQAPEATVIGLKNNDGFAGGNNAALKIIVKKNYEFVFLVNMDTVVESNCLEKIIKEADRQPKATAWQARLMLYPQTNLINSLGNETHFLGFGYCRAYRQPFRQDKDNQVKEISYASGAGVLYRVSTLRQLGLFDEKLWMYNEDQDICLRFWLAGFKVLLVPRAVVYHKYEFSRSITKYYWLDRNRLIVVFKHYHWLTILLLIPAFAIMEVGTLLFALKNSWWKEKLKVWFYFINPWHWPYLILARWQTQKLRKISERQFTKLLATKIWYQEINDWRLKLVNPLLCLYWRLIRLIMFW